MPAETRSPVATYIAAAVPPGSIDHATLLLTAESLRPVAGSALALGRLIAALPEQGNEPEIRRLKLTWWLEEIERIDSDRASHPLTVDLVARSTDRRWLQPLQTLIAAALQETSQPPIATLRELLPRCHQNSQRQLLLAAALPECNEPALGNAEQIGVGVSLTEAICAAASGQTRIAPDGFSDGTTAAQLAELAQSHFAATEAAPAAQREAQRSVYLQRHLYGYLLDRLKSRDYDPARARPHPMSLLWQAWRGARKLAT